MASGTRAGLNRRWHDRRPDIIGISLRKRLRCGRALSQNHPFIDRNKRVAVTAAFRRVNGYRLEFTDNAAFSFLMDLYETGRMRFGELDARLREHVAPEAE
jgi:prophage maintenance system killer protein